MLLDEARTQIDRLESEKLSAIQETNQINQVLESERDNQMQINTENTHLRSQISQLEANLESLRAQNQQEYEAVQDSRINQLNQTLDNLQSEKLELASAFEKLSFENEEMKALSNRQLAEYQQLLDSKEMEFRQNLNESQNAIENINNEKERITNAYYELENKYQQAVKMIQDKDIQLGKYHIIIDLCFS